MKEIIGKSKFKIKKGCNWQKGKKNFKSLWHSKL